MKHHSATFDIAAEVGVSVDTVQRFLDDVFARDARMWWNALEPHEVKAVIAALKQGQKRSKKQPRRHAPGRNRSLQYLLF